MARPRLGDKERRTRTLGVRLTAAEGEAFQEQACAAHLGVGAYVRCRAGRVEC